MLGTSTARRTTAALAVTLATATMVTVADGAASARRSRAAGAPLSFVATAISVATPDPSYPQPGDVEVLEMKNTSHGARIGADHVACWVLDHAGHQECSVTVDLPGGSLQVAYATMVTAKTIDATIVGGTGRFARTRGYFALTPAGTGSYEVVLHRQ